MKDSVNTTSLKTNLDSVHVGQNLPNENENGGLLDILYVVLVYTILEDRGFRLNNPCVGVLLRPNLVLTTLSCLEISAHGAIDIELIFVYVKNSQVLKPERVFIQPDVTEGPNVVLILFETSMVKDFPKLPEKEFKVNDFEFCTLYGFGTNESKLRLEDFTEMRINTSDMEVCNRFGRGDKWLCLHFENSMPCRGDVGAPLVCDGAIYAIFNPLMAPWAPPTCQDTYDAAFTPLYSFVPWIQRVNSSLDIPILTVLNTPWCWLGTGISALAIIVIIYYAIMRYVDWKCTRDDRQSIQAMNEPRVIYVRSSQFSRITTRWLWPKQEENV